MISFPNAKINIGLQVLGKRPDGYHNIQSVFYPIPFCDALEIVESKEFNFQSSGLKIPGGLDSNLCIKAYKLLQSAFGIGSVNMHLHKVIPMGAGLGGGSSDGAFTLKMLNELFKLDLTDDQLHELAAEIGSDCPFFIRNQPVLATGTGTDFTSLNVNLKGKYIALSNPEIHIGTAEAYKGVDFSEKIDLKNLIESEPIEGWDRFAINDFEHHLFRLHPEIKTIKKQMYSDGALFASMTGSGSTVYGVFDEKPDYPIAYQLEDYQNQH
ncbi:MAG: 4-(cytidine 5'-diphospho)-2-C-methyl-D-erythritol kinase [Cyclobacteriaceae bacterium]